MTDMITGFPAAGKLAEVAAQRARQRAAWREAGLHRGVNMVEAFHEGLGQRRDTMLRFLAEGHSEDLTIGQLFEQGAAVATALTEVGVRPGARIALHVPNWPEAMSALYAALLLRAVVVPIPSIYGPAEVRFILQDARVDTYVLADRWRKQDYLGTLSRVSDVPGLERIIVIGDTVPPGCLAWSEITERARRAEPTPLMAHHVNGQSLCFVVYTSGSTADPKGGQHSHDTFLAEFAQTRRQLAEPGRYLQIFPGGHVAGLLGMLRPLLFGQETIIMDHWDPDLAATVTDDLGITNMIGAPFYLATLLDAADRLGSDLHTLGDMLVGFDGRPASDGGAGPGGRAAPLPLLRVDRAPYCDVQPPSGLAGRPLAHRRPAAARHPDPDHRRAGPAGRPGGRGRDPDLWPGPVSGLYQHRGQRRHADAGRVVPHRRHRLPDPRRPAE